jgi:hypothetical protein
MPRRHRRGISILTYVPRVEVLKEVSMRFDVVIGSLAVGIALTALIAPEKRGRGPAHSPADGA